MSSALSGERLRKCVRFGSINECIDLFSDAGHAARRAVAGQAVELFRDADERRVHGEQRSVLQIARRENDRAIQCDIAGVAVLMSATLAELKKLGWRIAPDVQVCVEVFRALTPAWIDEWVEWLADEQPRTYPLLRALHAAGLCTKPASDGYVLGMIECFLRPSRWRLGDWRHEVPLAQRLGDVPDIVAGDVWRIFEVEGGGDLSLAAHDKYVADSHQWATALAELAANGAISRAHLLDGSLSALERDFAQFRAGWFSRFHERLAPSLDEREQRLASYLQLLGSSIAPTVTLALKAIAELDKHGKLGRADLLTHMRPVLHARAKSTVVLALRLLRSTATRDPRCAPQAARLAASALVHEAADVQMKALDVIEAHGDADDATLRAELLEYSNSMAASVKDRFATLCGGLPAPVTVEISHDDSAQLARAAAPQALVPLESIDALIERFLEVLENPHDPLEVEQVLDGAARLGAAREGNFARLAGPLGKRAKTLLARPSSDALKLQLARLAAALVFDDVPMGEPLVAHVDPNIAPFVYEHRSDLSFEFLLAQRIQAIVDSLARRDSLPLLAMPTDRGGFVSPAALVHRYRQYLDMQRTPDAADLALALLRAGHSERDAARGALATARGEVSDAIRFCLGEDVPVGDTPWLWLAAAAGRAPSAQCPMLVQRHGLFGPDGGVPARYALEFPRRGRFVHKRLRVTPAIDNGAVHRLLPVAFHVMAAGNYCISVCGHHPNMIRWCSTIWPSNPEAFFSQGVGVLDLDRPLANSPFVAFFEPLLDAHVPFGTMGTTLLMLGLATSDTAVRSVALDAAIIGVEQGRLEPAAACQAMAHILPAGHVRIARWTRCLVEIASVSARHQDFVRVLIAGALRDDPNEAPRDMGGLVELLFELHVAAATPLVDADARRYLQLAGKGGKLGKFARKMLAL